jgi:predicted Zn-dependent peptidase
LRAFRVKSLQTAITRATYLAQYELFDKDPGLVNTESDEMLKVTSAQIQAAAKKYLTPEKRNVIEIQPRQEGK